MAARQIFFAVPLAKLNDVYGHNFELNHLKLRSSWLKIINAIYLLIIGPRTKKSGHPSNITSTSLILPDAIVHL